MVTGANGALTVQTVAALGITEIGLRADATQRDFADGSGVTGMARPFKSPIPQTPIYTIEGTLL